MIATMDDRRVGALLRELRHRKRWRQSDLAERASVSQQFVADLESGSIERMDLIRARRVAAALGASLEIAARWRGPDVDRLLDLEHARLVEAVADELRAASWEVAAEWTFSHFGERGSVDLVGWHAGKSTLLVVEVKTRIVDVQALLSSVNRKVRLAPTLLAAERGWQAASVGRLLALPAGSTSRDAIARHPVSLGSAFPARNVAIRRWIVQPRGPLAGVLFVRATGHGGIASGRPPRYVARVHSPRS